MRILWPLLASATLLGCSDAPSDSVQSTSSETMTTQQPTQYPRLKALSTPAPVADKVDYSYERHGVTVKDPYNWIRDQEYPTINDEPVLDYLKAENAYYYEFLGKHTELVDTLFEEFKGRVDETEESVPYQQNGYQYRWEFKQGDNYRTYYRKPLDGGDEEVFLDLPKLAEGNDYFVIGGWDISPDNRYLTYSVDTNGDESYDLFVQDLQTGKMLDDKLSGVAGGGFFTQDGQLVYSKLQEGRWRVESINLHKLGTPQDQDKVLMREEDEGYFIGAYTTSSEEWIVISSGRSDVTEVHVIPADNPTAPAVKVVDRTQQFEVSLDHANGDFYLIANDSHPNSRLVKVADTDPAYENWQTLIEGSDSTYLRSVRAFKSQLVLTLREQGLDRIRVMPYEKPAYDIQFPEDVYTARLGNNPEFDQQHIRINYESMVTPDTVYDYSLADQSLALKKQSKIPSGYDKSAYQTERIMVTARDGVQVPVSLVYKKGLKKDGSAPMWLYGYGAYGAGMSPSFSTIRKSMLDRGFVYAIAHIRGGDEMGHQWYLDGKLKKRQNTFNDFIDVAHGLIDRGYTSKGNISISGRSAGGELMGVVTVQAPELWRSVILGVPFVDVMNTMLDASLPLTPPEWEEWGNPIESEEDFHTIMAYSPYDNIEQREYPPMMVTGGLNDPRVTYWEPAKWTAKMRALKTDDNLLVMRMNMGAGHFANSGRYGRLKDYAEEYAFMLVSHGITK